MFAPHGIETSTGCARTDEGRQIVTGHFGNWELGGLLMRNPGLPLDVVAMPEADETSTACATCSGSGWGRDDRGPSGVETALQIRSDSRRTGRSRSLWIATWIAIAPRCSAGRPPLRTPALLSYLTGALYRASSFVTGQLRLM
jgi:hypothetical protein